MKGLKYTCTWRQIVSALPANYSLSAINYKNYLRVDESVVVSIDNAIPARLRIPLVKTEFTRTAGIPGSWRNVI